MDDECGLSTTYMSQTEPAHSCPDPIARTLSLNERRTQRSSLNTPSHGCQIPPLFADQMTFCFLAARTTYPSRRKKNADEETEGFRCESRISQPQQRSQCVTGRGDGGVSNNRLSCMEVFRVCVRNLCFPIYALLDVLFFHVCRGHEG